MFTPAQLYSSTSTYHLKTVPAGKKAFIAGVADDQASVSRSNPLHSSSFGVASNAHTALGLCLCCRASAGPLQRLWQRQELKSLWVSGWVHSSCAAFCLNQAAEVSRRYSTLSDRRGKSCQAATAHRLQQSTDAAVAAAARKSSSSALLCTCS